MSHQACSALRAQTLKQTLKDWLETYTTWAPSHVLYVTGSWHVDAITNLHLRWVSCYCATPPDGLDIGGELPINALPQRTNETQTNNLRATRSIPQLTARPTIMPLPGSIFMQLTTCLLLGSASTPPQYTKDRSNARAEETEPCGQHSFSHWVLMRLHMIRDTERDKSRRANVTSPHFV